MSSFFTFPLRVVQGGRIQFSLTGYINEQYKIVVTAPNGSKTLIPESGIFDENHYLASDNSEEPQGALGFIYQGNMSLTGRYKVTVEFKDSYPNSITKYFEVRTEAEYNTPWLTYPEEVLQNQIFSWSLENITPGDSLVIRSEGPNDIKNFGPFIAEAVYIGDDAPPIGILKFDDDKYEYSGTYTNLFTMSGTGKQVTNTVVVRPKIYINYPATVTVNQAFTYDISGGDINETWSAQITGPISWNVSGSLNGTGTQTYNDALFTSVGYYDVIWTFPNSGKIKKTVHVISDGSPGPDTDGIHPEGTPLSFSEIDAEFNLGGNLNTYRDDRWFLKNGDYGNFDVNSLDFAEFYRKKSVDPAVPGSVYYYIPGHTTFAIPLHRNQVTIEVWGAGGGCGTSAIKGADSIVNYPGNYMVAGGGTGSGGGGRRYFSPGGEGGTASGGQTNINGNHGGEDMAAFVKGGTGATAPNGGAGGAGGTPYGVPPATGGSPGGGGGGVSWRDYSSDPGYGGAGGGGSGAYCTITANIPTGTIIDVTVGAGAHDSYSAGGDGAVKISWY